jgi:Fe-S-cluster-containing hydrogenase component 2
MKACPLKAIKIICGIHASVCHKTCIGCGRCRTACSASVIRMEASA